MELKSVILLFLFLCLLGHLECTDQKELTVKGEDATLECSGPTDATLVMIRWEKSDLQSEDIVILFRDGRFQGNLQHELFKGRVEMKDPKWKETGDFSVILKHVTMNHSGTYKCEAGYDGQKPRSLNNVTLKVENSGQREGQSGDGGKEDGGKEDEGEKSGSAGLIAGLIVALVILVAAFASFLSYRKHKTQNRDSYQPPVEKHHV